MPAHPASFSELFAQARHCQESRDFRQAERLYEELLRSDAGNAQGWCGLGTVLQAQGRLGESVHSFKQALALSPGLTEANRRLGMTYAEMGQWNDAIACYEQVLRSNPDDVEALFHAGNAHAAQGRLGHAVLCFQRIVRLMPDHVDAHTSLGIVYARQGHVERALASLQRAVGLRPDYAKAQNNLGVALAEMGRRDEALAAWREAVRLKPEYAEAHFNIAVGLSQQGQPDEAIAAYERAVQLKPDYAEALNNLGLALVEQNRFHEAIAVLEQAIRCRPNYAEAHNNLGLAQIELGRYREMIASFQEALRLNPGYTEAHNNYGTALAAMARPHDALAVYQLALWIRPDYAEVHWNRSLAWLQTGAYEQGWREYEWRWRRKRARPRRFDRPMWDGGPLDGRTIFLWTEQGRGDCIQFVRYAELVKARGGRVILEAPPDLEPLLATCPGVDRTIAEGAPLPDYDVQASLMSLPGLMGTTLDTVPASVYLFPPAELVERCRSVLATVDAAAGISAERAPLKVGITWQGNPRHKWDRHRSFPLSRFRALAQIPGVRLYSLQRGAGSEQLDALASRADAFAVTPTAGLVPAGVDPFLWTAALLKCLDLAIVCDSAPAHLAGALGVPTWMPLSFLVDWRWMHEREDTPWYPTMRLFRQRELGDWDLVFRRLAEELAQRAAAHQH